ncbi:hypothetical protein [Crenobacter intestini]|uniref:Uncharacterized protein n=1 Tax=Crenobacter intestini TaxID=2563443 RepID=A0A4T0UKW4_9NEIS|nr:hypothetical protein [Crenobacter intestini]TIC79208.1 hypothetical protein E5K04_13990 [Crenobacter intestini]
MVSQGDAASGRMLRTASVTREVFVAKAPYAATIGENSVPVDLGADRITHDFSGNVPFFNQEIGRSDILTVNVWNPQTGSQHNVVGHSLTDVGVPGYVFKQNGYTAIGVRKRDGLVDGTQYTRVNAFQIPTRRHFEWQLKFRLAGSSLSQQWKRTRPGEAPATLWSLQSAGLAPALVMGVDTDPSNGNRLSLNFDSRIDPAQGAKRVLEAGGLDPAAEQDVRIEAFLDERTAEQGGQGFLRISVNGRVVHEQQGPTVQAGAYNPYGWSVGMNTLASKGDRFAYFKTARLMAVESSGGGSGGGVGDGGLVPPSGDAYVAHAPYLATVGNHQVPVDLGASKITHDFSGSVPFFNPEIGRSDIITINVWNPQTQSAQNVMGHSLSNEGVKDRVFKDGDFTAIGVVAGDGIVEEKLRTQVNAFQFSTRKHYEWQLQFRLGGRRLGQPWHMAPAGESPATIWQLKTIGFGPALGMVVDTDPNNPNKVQLHFDARIDPSQGGKRLTQIGNLDPNAEQDVRIETYLDERTAAQGGRGFLKITVNGQVLFDQPMPTVQAGATNPYNWSMGMYLYANTRPLSYDRFIYFRTARLVDLGGDGDSGGGDGGVMPPPPPLNGSAYVAYAPYQATIGNTQLPVDLGASKITHDFGGSVPFFNPEIGRSDIITINVWNPQTQSAQNVMGHSLSNEGVKDRVFKDGDFTAIGVVAGDGIVEEKLRTQVNAFQFSTRKHYEWQMQFRLGGRRLGQPWHMAPAGESPATIWQLKTIGFGPALGMVVDTDPNNPNRVQLHFDARIDPSQGGKRLTQIGNLDPNVEQDVRIETYLDERTAAQGGRGFLKITVNGQVLFDQPMPTVQAGATNPYNWSMGMYLYANTRPLSYDRFIYFRNARMVALD